MAKIWAAEERVNRDQNCRYGDSDPYETRFENPGELYKSCVKQFGRCISKVYIDKAGESIQVGWVFLKRVEYEREWNKPIETYLQEMWVTLHKGPPTRKTTFHYLNEEANSNG